MNISALIAAALSLHGASASPQPELRLIETSTSFASEVVQQLAESAHDVGKLDEETTLLLVPADRIQEISQRSHLMSGHCGGFIDVTHESKTSRVFRGQEERNRPRAALPKLQEKKDSIAQALKEIRAENIERFDRAYSSQFKTRDARTADGKHAPEWLQKTWQKMADEAHRDDIRVDLIPPPKGYEQASVRIWIRGEAQDAPIVVLGAHLDSANARGQDMAPGADDDGSGISALTETYRVMLKSGFRPKTHVHIFGYAAEELGLLGSRAIAEHYQKQNANVLGALQLDMVAYPGEDREVTFITDNVDKNLSLWTEQIFGMYVGTKIRHERCGYACSDHASWSRYGFASVMPFESMMDKMNPRIHSAKDVWDDKLDAEYASQFSKLAYSFAAELSKAELKLRLRR